MPFRGEWRGLAFIAAFALYALWGSPTPNNPDWVEGAIALLLFVAVGWRIAVENFTFYKHYKLSRWELAAKILLIYGFTVPVLVGVIQGNDVGVILRDLVAFIFLCLPLFFVRFVAGDKGRERIFFYLTLMVGLVFAIRVLVPHFLLFRNTTELLYLANSPLVLMSALFLAGAAGLQIYQKTTLSNLVKAGILISLASLPILSMFVDLQRASFAALVLSAVSLSAIGFVKAPKRMVFPFIIMGLGVLIFQDYFLHLISGVGAKTSQVGLNMRAQELQAVWESVSATPLNIILGLGWGSHFASPAVGELNVTYTHSFLTYIFLKTGLVGLGLSVIYLYFIFEKLVRVYLRCPVKGNALIWPFLIPLFLYASHKSFDFGVLLSLIIIMAGAREKTHA